MCISIHVNAFETDFSQVVSHNCSVLVMCEHFCGVIQVGRFADLNNQNAILREGVIKRREVLLIVVESITELTLDVRIKGIHDNYIQEFVCNILFVVISINEPLERIFVVNLRTIVISAPAGASHKIAAVTPSRQILTRDRNHDFIYLNHDRVLDSIVLENFTESRTFATTDNGHSLWLRVRKKGWVHQGFVIGVFSLACGLHDSVQVDNAIRREKVWVLGVVGAICRKRLLVVVESVKTL
mmetsp:Transcript_7420/g.12349  ORF Transcript_7420/g.12349 Transcript_7420/m.12349 type:complete len:241 (+) Transcript_7420:944-1666(+)